MDRLTLSTRAACALFTLLLVPPSPGFASEPPSYDAALDAIAAYAPRAMREQGTPGLSIAITDSTRTLRVITLGYADSSAQTPVTARTRFAIGSITKSMTALALLQLADAGRLDLKAPVTKYLPWFSINSKGVPVLVHQLLSHSGGIPDDYSFSPGYVDNIFALRYGAHALRARYGVVVFERRLRNRRRHSRATRRPHLARCGAGARL